MSDDKDKWAKELLKNCTTVTNKDLLALLSGTTVSLSADNTLSEEDLKNLSESGKKYIEELKKRAGVNWDDREDLDKIVAKVREYLGHHDKDEWVKRLLRDPSIPDEEFFAAWTCKPVTLSVEKLSEEDRAKLRESGKTFLREFSKRMEDKGYKVAIIDDSPAGAEVTKKPVSIDDAMMSAHMSGRFMDWDEKEFALTPEELRARLDGLGPLPLLIGLLSSSSDNLVGVTLKDIAQYSQTEPGQDESGEITADVSDEDKEFIESWVIPIFKWTGNIDPPLRRKQIRDKLISVMREELISQGFTNLSDGILDDSTLIDAIQNECAEQGVKSYYQEAPNGFVTEMGSDDRFLVTSIPKISEYTIDQSGPTPLPLLECITLRPRGEYRVPGSRMLHVVSMFKRTYGVGISTLTRSEFYSRYRHHPFLYAVVDDCWSYDDLLANYPIHAPLITEAVMKLIVDLDTYPIDDSNPATLIYLVRNYDDLKRICNSGWKYLEKTLVHSCLVNNPTGKEVTLTIEGELYYYASITP